MLRLLANKNREIHERGLQGNFMLHPRYPNGRRINRLLKKQTDRVVFGRNLHISPSYDMLCYKLKLIVVSLVTK